MGTWDYGSFENDTAMDWVCGLATPEKRLFGLFKPDPFHYCIEPTEVAIDSKILDADVCCKVLAGAECIALLRGQPTPKLPDEILHWQQQNPGMEKVANNEETIRRVIEAVELVRNSNRSELRELWAESDDYENWLTEVDDLLARLGAD